MNKKLIFSLVLIAGTVSASFVLAAQPPNPQQPAAQMPSSQIMFNPISGVNNIPDLIMKIIQTISTLVAAVAVVMFIYAGAMFLFSAGKPELAIRARSVLIYAVLGIAIGLLGNGIVALIYYVLGVQS